MTRYEFINTLEITEKGHFPFQIWVELMNGKKIIGTLMLTDIISVYDCINDFIKIGNVKELHFSTDFKKIPDVIESDFVAVFTYDSVKWTCVIICYNDLNIKIFHHNTKLEEILLSQLVRFCNGFYQTSNPSG